MARTAAVLLIGNELLSGKIPDANLSFLGKELFQLGIALKRAVVCSDTLQVIADDIRDLRAHHDHVFTTGGIGPTHDDVTLAAAAAAFDRPLVRDPELVVLLQAHFGEKCTETHLRMADVPEGAELVASDNAWPTVCVDEVYVLPGVPAIVRAKFPGIRERLGGNSEGSGFAGRAIYTSSDEFEIAELLGGVAGRYPSLTLGSYLYWGKADYKVKLTVDGADKHAVDRATEELIAGLGPEAVIRIE